MGPRASPEQQGLNDDRGGPGMKTLGHGDCDGQAAGIQKPGAHTQMGRHPRMFTLTATHTPPPCSRPPSLSPPTPCPSPLLFPEGTSRSVWVTQSPMIPYSSAFPQRLLGQAGRRVRVGSLPSLYNPSLCTQPSNPPLHPLCTGKGLYCRNALNKAGTGTPSVANI